MHHRASFAIAFLFVLAPPLDGEQITLRGRVFGDDMALGQATVELRQLGDAFATPTGACRDRAAPPLTTVETDPSGFFELPADAGSSFRLDVSAPGHLTLRSHLPHVLEDIELPPVELPKIDETAARDAPLVVTDEAGDPIAGARVAVGLPSYDHLPWQSVTRCATTSATGRVLERMQVGRRGRIMVFALGYAPFETYRGALDEAPIELIRGVAQTLTIRDSEGHPVAGAQAWIGRQRWPAGTSDAEGRFTVYPAPNSEILVRVETASGRSGEQSIGAPKEPPAPRDFVLEEPVTISGLVVDAESERQLAGARVWLRDTPSAFTDTDRYGKFHLVTAAAAWQRSWLRATRPGYLRSIARPRPRRSAKPATLPSPLELQPADTLFGRIVDAQGEPIDGAKILLQASQQIPHTTRSQPDGRFKAPAIGNVVYQIRVSKTAYLDEQREASVDDGPVDRGIRVVLRQGLEGFGRVVDRAGEPIDGAQVSLLTPDEAAQAHRGPGASHGPLTQQTTTDAAGRFELSNMQPGVLVDLEVTAPGYGTTHGGRREMVETSEAIDFGTVIMEPGHELRIQVVDPQGQPLPEASVSTEPWPARRAWQSPAETKTTADGEGRCILRDFAAGDKITVTAHHPAYTKQRLPGLEISHPEILTLVLEPKGKIAGLVVDDHGEPQPAASVSVLHQDGSGGFGTSHQADGEGRFEIEIDAADQLSLTARAADRRSDNLTLSLAPGQVVEDLRLVLAAGESLEGRVLDPSGEPLAQAYVRISGMDAQMFLAVRQRRTARTDRDGRFAFTGLTPGVVLLRVHSQGLPSAQQTIDLQPGVNRLEIRLPRPHQVHGRVVDAAGRPIGDAQVSLRSIDQNLGGSATSAADGSFTIGSVAEGQYRLTAKRQGFATANPEEIIEVEGGPITDLRIVLTAGGSITGRVLGIDPERLADVTVTLPAHSHSTSAAVDLEGRYRIDHLAAGDFTVVAVDARSRRQARGQATLRAGDREVELDLELGEGWTLAGQVTIDGEPATGARIKARGVDGATISEAWTDFRGMFRIDGLAAGGYTIEAQSGNVLRRQPVQLTANTEIDIEIRVGRVGGLVVDAKDVTPLAGARITLSPARLEVGAPPPIFDTDTFGRFDFRTAEGDYRLRVTHPGYAAQDHPVTVAEGVDSEHLEVRLEPTTGLDLRVRLANGIAPLSVSVAAINDAGQQILFDYRSPTADGTVRLASLPPGDWTLVIASWQAGTVRLRAAASSDTLPVALPPGSRLEVRVPALADSAQLATLRLTDSANQPFVTIDPQPLRLAETWPVRNGRATVEGLPPGVWNATVTTEDGQSWSAQTTAPGQIGLVRLVLD